MADDRHYVPGDFYRIDDRSGFKVRAKRTRKEWTNLIVDLALWEPRQPQDFVKGVVDDQSVPEPRPRQTDVFLGPLTTTTTATVLPGGQPNAFQGDAFQFNAFQIDGSSIPVQSSVRMAINDVVLIMLDNGVNFRFSIIDVPDAQTITVNPSVPSQVTAGALVTDLTADALASIA